MKRQSLPRRVALYLVALVLVPLALVGLLEIGLRLAGIGERQPLFVPAPMPGYLRPNEDVIHRFFAGTRGGPNVSIDTTFFQAEKPADSLRIVIQGGSSAAGFPYGKWAAPAGMLQQRLQRTWPNREVEVITTAMSAVNSYTLLDFQDEIMAVEPDAIVIYAGHNEFLGVLGVGSAYSSGLSPALTRLILELRRWRVVETAFQLAGPRGDSSSASPEGTLMARIAGDRSIPADSPTYRKAEEQFSENLNLLLERYAAAGIPVFVGTLASNERDQPPFVSAPVPPALASQWRELEQTVREALAQGQRDEAYRQAAALVRLDEASADASYLLGQAAEADRRPEEARHAFLAAKDLDELRFRAPESFNDIIRAAAVASGATLVDVQARLAAASPRGIIGDEMMLEHLHPNLEGYFLMSDAFYAAIVAAGIGGADARPVDSATARAEIPVTEAGRLAAEWRIQRLKGDWPFQDETRPFSLPPPTGEIEKIAQAWFAGQISWVEAMNRSLVYYQQVGRYGEAGRVAVNMTMAFPSEPNPQFVAGSMLLRDGQTQRALLHLRRAAELAPRETRYLLALAQAYFQAGMFAQSAVVLERVLLLEPGHPTAPEFLERARAAAAGGG
jgi:tetratricopeptide (TPR) repeat protein